MLVPALTSLVLLSSPSWATASAPSDDDLSAAFEAPKPAPARSAPVPAEHNVVAPPASEDPAEASKALFAEKFASALLKLEANDLGAARGSLPELEKLATAAGPEQWVQVRELSARSADKRQQQREAERWLVSCGADDTDACRARALDAFPPVAKGRVAQVRKADGCVREVERAVAAGKFKLATCLPGALVFYKRSRDGLMALRVRLAQARALALEPGKAPRAIAELGKLERACVEPRCLMLRRKVLDELVSLETREDHPEAAARAALLEQGLRASAVPAARRAHLRTEAVERSCGAYDAKLGKGACRKLEHSLNGAYSFRDFSAQALGEGLPFAEMAKVNEHYGVLIEECLTAEAARMTPPDSVAVRVRWMVLNDGKVDAVHVDPKSADEGALAACLREQFATWRYPTYRGEWQHVEQGFTVRASRR